MPRAPSARSATVVTTNNPVPQAAPSRSGRKRTLTDKQHQNGKYQPRYCFLDLTVYYAVVDQAAKENAMAKKAYTEALHAHQRNEEFTGFTRGDSFGPPESELEYYDDRQPFTTNINVNSSTPALPKTKTTYRNGHHLIGESEPDDDDDQQPFSSVTVNSSTPAPPKTTYHNGRRLVHRVNMVAESVDSAPVSITSQILLIHFCQIIYNF